MKKVQPDRKPYGPCFTKHKHELYSSDKACLSALVPYFLIDSSSVEVCDVQSQALPHKPKKR